MAPSPATMLLRQVTGSDAFGRNLEDTIAPVTKVHKARPSCTQGPISSGSPSFFFRGTSEILVTNNRSRGYRYSRLHAPVTFSTCLCLRLSCYHSNILDRAVRLRTFKNHARPFEPQSKVNFEDLITFGDKCPRNGSKNGQTAPRTGKGCPHEGPRVVPAPPALTVASQRDRLCGAEIDVCVYS